MEDTMRFRTERDEFADAVAWVSRTVSTRPTLPVLGGTLLELEEDRLRLASTDLEHTGEAVVQVSGEADGRIVVPGRMFGDVIRNLPAGMVEVEATEGGLHLRCGQISHELRLLDADDFPSLVQPSLERVGTVVGETLAGAANQVAKAAANDESRPVLTAVLFEATGERLTLAATDSYRLSVRELPWEWEHGETTALVPARSLSEAAKALAHEDKVEIGIENHQITFAGAGRRLTSRLVEGEFPPFRKLLPTGYENIATVVRQDLLDACKQVAPYGQNNNPIRLAFERDRIEVNGNLQDVGRGAAVIPAKYEGEQITVAFNPTYLSDGVGGVDDTEVVLEVRDGLKPALVHGNDPKGFTYLLMPVRLSS
jgi:DNA polymerase III subunit beta